MVLTGTAAGQSRIGVGRCRIMGRSTSHSRTAAAVGGTGCSLRSCSRRRRISTESMTVTNTFTANPSFTRRHTIMQRSIHSSSRSIAVGGMMTGVVTSRGCGRRRKLAAAAMRAGGYRQRLLTGLPRRIQGIGFRRWTFDQLDHIGRGGRRGRMAGSRHTFLFLHFQISLNTGQNGIGIISFFFFFHFVVFLHIMEVGRAAAKGRTPRRMTMTITGRSKQRTTVGSWNVRGLDSIVMVVRIMLLNQIVRDGDRKRCILDWTRPIHGTTRMMMARMMMMGWSGHDDDCYCGGALEESRDGMIKEEEKGNNYGNGILRIWP
jgi:hypothetical protein